MRDAFIISGYLQLQGDMKDLNDEIWSHRSCF